jgi:ferrous iron transport protein A
MTPLGLLAEGEGGVVGPGTAARRAADMGLRAGAGVRMLRNAGGGPLVVRVAESRLAVDRGLAMRIYVRREP